jgi:hypothetical protein
MHSTAAGLSILNTSGASGRHPSNHKHGYTDVAELRTALEEKAAEKAREEEQRR